MQLMGEEKSTSSNGYPHSIKSGSRRWGCNDHYPREMAYGIPKEGLRSGKPRLQNQTSCYPAA
jgi:hypothetical protein